MKLQETSDAELLGIHLQYEIDMLHGSYLQLAMAADLSGGTASSTVISNALIESFCVHARCLIEFFGTKRPKPGNRTYAWFTGRRVDEIERLNENLAKKFLDVLNRQVSHLINDGRYVDSTKKIDSKMRESILFGLRNEIEIFKSNLKLEFQEIEFVGCREQQVPSTIVLQTANTTTSIDTEVKILRYGSARRPTA